MQRYALRDDAEYMSIDFVERASDNTIRPRS